MQKLLQNKKGLIAIASVFIIALLSFVLYDASFNDVKLTLDEESMNIKTSKSLVEGFLKEQDIEIDKHDYINVSKDEELKDGMEIVIKKSVPVTINVGNKTIETKTYETTIKEALNQLEISYDEDDRINPGLLTDISQNIEINITKIDTERVVETEKIQNTTIYKDNNNMDIGKSKVVQKGSSGSKEITKEKIYENGKLVAEKVIDEDIIKNPVPKVVEKGNKAILVSSRGNLNYSNTLIMESTAYDLSYQSTGKRPGDKYYGITASGTKARPGVVAVDPRVIPLGTKLYIESVGGGKDYGFAVAEDTGSAIKGERIDLFFTSHSQAMAYGRRRVKVYILD